VHLPLEIFSHHPPKVSGFDVATGKRRGQHTEPLGSECAEIGRGREKGAEFQLCGKRCVLALRKDRIRGERSEPGIDVPPKSGTQLGWSGEGRVSRPRCWTTRRTGWDSLTSTVTLPGKPRHLRATERAANSRSWISRRRGQSQKATAP
jgi:hypothetical protein